MNLPNIELNRKAIPLCEILSLLRSNSYSISSIEWQGNFGFTSLLKVCFSDTVKFYINGEPREQYLYYEITIDLDFKTISVYHYYLDRDAKKHTIIDESRELEFDDDDRIQLDKLVIKLVKNYLR